jgi:hypothetical protein
VVAVQVITKDPIKRKITHGSLIHVERTSLKDLKKQSSPSLLPPSRMDAGTTPLVSNPTLNAEADLKKGLTMEVALSGPFAGLWIDPRRTLDAGRLSPAVEVELEEEDFQLQSCWTEDAKGGAKPTPAEKIGPPSNSPHLPRAGGDRRRRRARRSSHPTANEARVAAAREELSPSPLATTAGQRGRENNP